MAWWWHAMPRHGLATVKLTSICEGKWWHWCWKVRGGARASEEGQRWTWSSQIFGMGMNFVPAHQVFVKMAERTLFLNFVILFGVL